MSKKAMLVAAAMLALLALSCVHQTSMHPQGGFITVENRDNDSWRHVRTVEIFLADGTLFLRQDVLLVYRQAVSYGVPDGEYFVRVFASMGTGSRATATSESFELIGNSGAHLRFRGRALEVTR